MVRTATAGTDSEHSSTASAARITNVMQAFRESEGRQVRRSGHAETRRRGSRARKKPLYAVMGIRRLQAIRDLNAIHAVFAIRLVVCSLPREKQPEALTCVAAGTSDRRERQGDADCRLRGLCAASYASDNCVE